MERRWAAFPDKKDRKQEEAEIAGFRGLPDQLTASSRPSSLPHEPASTFVPLSIDGGSATYFFDIGAWISCMSELEANRLHLTIRNTSGTLGQSAGSQVGFRTAVAREVVIGQTHFKNVSFAVFPDNQEPWTDLPAGHKGIIGMPMPAGLETLRWEKAGKLAMTIHRARFIFKRPISCLTTTTSSCLRRFRVRQFAPRWTPAHPLQTYIKVSPISSIPC